MSESYESTPMNFESPGSYDVGTTRLLVRTDVPCVMLPGMRVEFEAELWLWEARRTESWTFVSVPAEASDDIRELSAGPRRGFGSVRVRVRIGASTWTTSVFPDKSSGCYVLPVKRAVRTAEALDVGDVATVTVELVDL